MAVKPERINVQQLLLLLFCHCFDTLRFGNSKAIRLVKKTECWYAGGGDFDWMFWNSSCRNRHLRHPVLQQNAEQLIQIDLENGIFKTSVLCCVLKVHQNTTNYSYIVGWRFGLYQGPSWEMMITEVIITQWYSYNCHSPWQLRYLMKVSDRDRNVNNVRIIGCVLMNF